MNRRTRPFSGMFYLGPVGIPPSPVGIVFSDRADGRLWWLSNSGDYIALNDSLPAWLHNTATEPVFESNGRLYRLFVRDGRLGYELVTDDDGVRDPPIYTRRRGPVSLTVYRITAVDEDGRLAYGGVE